MNELSLFFAENVEQPEVVDFVVSNRFKDKEGNILKWKIRPVTDEESKEAVKSCTKKVKTRRGNEKEFDENEYMTKLVIRSVVYPDLHDAELQKSYGVLGAESLLGRMLLAGESSKLAKKVQEISDFDEELEDLKEEIKN